MNLRRFFRLLLGTTCPAVLIFGMVSLPAAVQQSGNASPPAVKTLWKAGIASAAVTPKELMWMAGYAARKKPAEGTIQELYVKALVLEDQAGTRQVIITSDLIGIPRPLRQWLEKRLVEKYQLPPRAILINASHTHCGPEFRMRGEASKEPESDRARQSRKYVAFLQAQLERVVDQAMEGRFPATVSYGHARAGFAMNRRLPVAGEYRNSPYPDGPVDHDVPILKIEDEKGTLKGVLFGYACHNTTLSFFQFCGDYAGYAQQYLQEAHPGATAMFLTGCGGDQNPYPRGTLELAQQHGRALANAVEAALIAEPKRLNGPLSAALEETAAEYAAPPGRAELLERKEKGSEYVREHAALLLEQLEKDGKLNASYPYTVQVIRFGDQLILTALAGEVVVDYSLRLKRELAGPAVWVAGYSNDVFAYIPSRRVLKEGGYEAGGAMVYSRSFLHPGPFAESIEEKIVAKVHELAQATQAALDKKSSSAAESK